MMMIMMMMMMMKMIKMACNSDVFIYFSYSPVGSRRRCLPFLGEMCDFPVDPWESSGWLLGTKPLRGSKGYGYGRNHTERFAGVFFLCILFQHGGPPDPVVTGLK